MTHPFIPSRASAWRVHNDFQTFIGIALTLVGVVALSCFFVLLLDLMSSNPRIHRVDCGMASFHPDIKNEVRKACRERGEA